MGGVVALLILAFRVLSVGLTGFSIVQGWHAVDNATNFGVGVSSPAASDIGGMIVNVFLTMLSGTSWFVKIKPAVEWLQRFFAGSPVSPSPVPVPEVARTTRGAVADVLVDVASWMDADPSNDRPLEFRGSAHGFDIAVSAKPAAGKSPVPQNDQVAALLESVAAALNRLDAKLPAPAA